MSDELISFDQAAEILGCHKMTVRRLIKRGELGEVIKMSSKRVRIRRGAVDEYIARHVEETK